MCRRVKCGQCGRPTYVGCGQHIEQVLGDVPVAERCSCQDAKGNAPASSLAWLRRLFS